MTLSKTVAFWIVSIFVDVYCIFQANRPRMASSRVLELRRCSADPERRVPNYLHRTSTEIEPFIIYAFYILLGIVVIIMLIIIQRMTIVYGQRSPWRISYLLEVCRLWSVLFGKNSITISNKSAWNGFFRYKKIPDPSWHNLKLRLQFQKTMNGLE